MIDLKLDKDNAPDVHNGNLMFTGGNFEELVKKHNDLVELIEKLLLNKGD